MFVSETLHPLCRQPFNNLLVGFDIESSSNISFQEYYQLFSFSHLFILCVAGGFAAALQPRGVW
jgi:hypothetical protein